MPVFSLVLLIFLNFAISWWDAFAAGMIWTESKAQGGFMYAVAWAAAVESACGFTLTFACLLALWARHAHLLPEPATNALLDLTYVLAVPPLIGAGLIILQHSYISFWRDRSLLSMGVSAWNTYAMAYDTVNMVENMVDAFFEFVDFVRTEEKDGDFEMVAFVVLLASCSLGAGILLTYVIARSNLHRLPLPARGRAYAGSNQQWIPSTTASLDYVWPPAPSMYEKSERQEEPGD